MNEFPRILSLLLLLAGLTFKLSVVGQRNHGNDVGVMREAMWLLGNRESQLVSSSVGGHPPSTRSCAKTKARRGRINSGIWLRNINTDVCLWICTSQACLLKCSVNPGGKVTSAPVFLHIFSTEGNEVPWKRSEPSLEPKGRGHSKKMGAHPKYY